MATVNKNFRIKNGLVVEGSTATVNGQNILTETGGDNYILNLIGGETLVKSVDTTVFNVDGSGNLTINANTFDSYGSASSAQTAAENYTDNAINALDTDDIEEGASNKYFTNQRALDATSSAYDAAGSASAAQTAAQSYADTAASNAQSAAENYADGLISTEVTNRNNAISTAKSEAISSANGYTDGEIITALSTAASDATTKANNALLDANDYTDSAITQEVSDRNSAISTAITNLNLSGTYDALGAASQALSDANDYTDTAVSNLVDSAPALLDTLNELAAAIADNPNYATDVANLVATKADTTYVDGEISALDTAAQGYASTAQSNAQSFATTAANNAQSAAEDYADSLASNYDAAGSASTAQSNAETFATNAANAAQTAAENYADSLASNYDAAGSASTAQSNAENYAEGLVDNVLDGTTAFTAININSVAKEVAATATIASAGSANAITWSASSYRTAKALVKFETATHSQVSEVLLTLDAANNIAITEYAEVGTNGSLGTVSASYNSGTIAITVTTAQANTDVMVKATLLS